MSITPAAPYDPNTVRSMHEVVPFEDASAAAQSERPNKPNPADAFPSDRKVWPYVPIEWPNRDCVLTEMQILYIA